MRRATLLALPALLLVGCGDGALNAADTAACNTLSENSDAAIDGAETALQELANGLGDAGGDNDPYTDKISPYAQLVAAQAQLELSGADSDLAENVGQLRGVCQAEGWRSSN